MRMKITYSALDKISDGSCDYNRKIGELNNEIYINCAHDLKEIKRIIKEYESRNPERKDVMVSLEKIEFLEHTESPEDLVFGHNNSYNYKEKRYNNWIFKLVEIK